MAAAESHLGTDRLMGEVGRTTFQLRLFAEVLDEGSYLEVTIDEPDPSWPPAPRPDLRRMLVPLGPVVVFAASNFPFAFSVAGGDTASALAAGCPVVVKAHPGHPRLSALTGEIVAGALGASGAPAGVFAVIYGDEAGRAAVTSPTTSGPGPSPGHWPGGGPCSTWPPARPGPHPLLRRDGQPQPRLRHRRGHGPAREQILAGFATSFTLSAGQFCTKPGLLFVPSGSVTDEELVRRPGPHRSGTALLNGHIHDGYVARAAGAAGPSGRPDGGGRRPRPTGPRPRRRCWPPPCPPSLAAGDELLVECFGPTSLVVGYETTRSSWPPPGPSGASWPPWSTARRPTPWSPPC